MKQPYVSTLISQNFTSEEKALARQNIDAVSSADVENQIESHISSLDCEDSAVSHQFVTSVSETDGIVSISRRQPQISDVEGLEDALSERLSKIQSDWDQTDTEKASYIKNKPENLVQDSAYVHTDNNFTTTLKNKLDGIQSGAEVNVQSNWNESDTSSDSYIQNKPANLVQDASYVHTDNNFTDADVSKLASIASGAEVNVQSDWSTTDQSADSFIKNKPTIPAAQVNSDWNASSGVAAILNKPSIPSIKTTSTTLPPVDTNVSNMTLFTDGRVTVNNSTDVGLLCPVGTQSDAGKVLTGAYTGSPGKFTAAWRTVQSPLSAGNGISIANNVVSVKTKAGGGLDVGADGVYVKGHYVSYDANQGLNTTNQTNARNNINAFEAPDMTNAQPWQVVRLNENLKPTLGFAPEMYGGVYDYNLGLIIGGDGDTWKKKPTIKLGATQEGATVTDNVYQIYAMPRFWNLDGWMITDGYALAWSRVEYVKNNQKYFDYQYRSVSLSSSANKHDLTTTYTGFANDGDSLHISLDLVVYALRSSAYSARTAMFHVDIFWGFYLSNGVLGDIGYWNGYSIAPCGAFNGSTLIWPVEN